MSLRAYRTFQALILAASGLGMLALALDGHMLDYIHPRFIVLTGLAALAMIILAQFVLRERPPENETVSHQQEDSSSRSASSLWWAVLPLLVGLLVSEPQPAASTAQQRQYSGAVGQTQMTGGVQTAVKDWIFAADESNAAARISMPGMMSGWPQSVPMFKPRWPSGAWPFLPIKPLTDLSVPLPALFTGMINP